MHNETTIGSLRDIAEVIMGTSPPGDTCNQSGVGIPLLNGPTEFGEYHPTPVQFTTSPVRICEKGDLLFCVRGSTTGRMNWADKEYAIGRGLAAIRHKDSKSCQHFVRAAIDYGLRHLLSKAVGSTFPSVSRVDIQSTPCIIPSLDVQIQISNVLSSFSDKIELNRKINVTLESIAQAMFKSWFIDFDPVHRNAAQRSGGKIKTTPKESSFNLASEVDSLFPDSFEESDIGPIPNGWTVELLGNHATVTRGLSYKGSGLADAGKPMFNLNSVLEGGGYKKAGLKYYTGDYFDKHEVLPGDLIVANTEQGFDRLLIGYAAVVPEYFVEGGIYSHHVYRVRPTAISTLTARYLERWINSPLPHDWITGYSNGTTVNMLPVDGLTNAQVLLPPFEIIRTFTNLATSIAVQQQANDQASMHYSQTRDLLLPQLMTGSLAIDNSGQE
ncbi:MAG: restriction endonuclease subunit S [Planctomycetaceae bacterium]|nr:restriction endonuclease subunit S [Planctomycetaceae bacterium]